MRKIAFSDKFKLTDSVLDGCKTQFRCVVPNNVISKIINEFKDDYYEKTLDTMSDVELINHYYFAEKLAKPPYIVGEKLAVAQTYESIINNKAFSARFQFLLDEIPGWKDNKKVKAEKMIHHITITSVRIEKLQDISDNSCLKEGVEQAIIGDKEKKSTTVYGYRTTKEVWFTPREAFIQLINKVHRKNIWKENPYVFVFNFILDV